MNTLYLVFVADNFFHNVFLILYNILATKINNYGAYYMKWKEPKDNLMKVCV